jgi:hypothetical protein
MSTIISTYSTLNTYAVLASSGITTITNGANGVLGESYFDAKNRYVFSNS